MVDNKINRTISGEIYTTSEFKTVQKGPEEFLEKIDHILSLPNVTAVGWRQYTPYFNDGDTCVFSISDIMVKLDYVATGGEEGNFIDSYSSIIQEGVTKEYRRVTNANGYDAWDYKNTKLEQGPRKDIAEAMDDLDMDWFEDVCLRNFGDHAFVQATTEGFQVEYYEHD